MENKIKFISIFSFFIIAFVIFTTAENTVFAQEQPAVIKNSIRIRAYTLPSYRVSYDTWSWIPEVAFRLSNSLPSGGKAYIEFTQPGGAAWVKVDCQSSYNGMDLECGGRDRIPDDKSTTAVGVSTFNIKLRNELVGTDVTLFTGKAKIEKAKSDERGPKALNKVVYFVNYDWAMPIGYAHLDPDKNTLLISFWVRGDQGSLEPHLFYQGKEVGKVVEAESAACRIDTEILTTRSVDASIPQKASWTRMRCEFYTVLAEDNGKKSAWKIFYLNKNPGEYEFKLLRNNNLARTMKFSVGTNGQLDYSVSDNNKLGSKLMVVPIQILGEADGQWNKLAWKTEAFFGNPLTGFTVQ